MNREEIEQAVRLVLKALAKAEGGNSPAPKPIPVEGSARHVHLSREDCLRLFGQEALDIKREISQPGQFLAQQRVRLIGPKGVIDNVAVLGPVREKTQVELSLTDGRTLGVGLPVNLSGDLTGAASLHIQAKDKLIEAPGCAIAALRHLHMPQGEAAAFGVHDKQVVSVRVEGARPLILEGVVVRVSGQATLALHIDIDEFNAGGCCAKSTCVICGGSGPCASGAPAAPTVQQELPAPTAPTAAASEYPGRLIAETEARQLAAQGLTRLVLRRGQLITPLARDLLRQRGIAVEQEVSR